jgi:SnoaL-like domain
MAIQDIAKEIVALLGAGKDEEVGRRFWSPSVRSIEAAGPELIAEGSEAVARKGEWFVANNEVHGVKAEGPFVNGDQFAVRLTYELTHKDAGQRKTFDEVALYTIADGKIVEERFLYGS